MEKKKLLIAGIDPGITTAYAVLDIEGNLVHLNSSKQLDLSRLISETINFGKIVLVGTDKVKVPRLVEAFATKVGARILRPEEDLKVDEKRKMIDKFSFGDEHQGDALASALFAYKEAKPLLDRIDSFAGENKKKDIRDRIKELVIAKKISIKSAAGIIEKNGEEERIIEKVVVENRLSENDFLRMYGKLKSYEEEIKLVKNYNNNLRNRVTDLEKMRNRREVPKIDNKKPGEFRDSRIRFLETKVAMQENEIERLRSLVKKLSNVLSNASNFYILKKLDTLGINEFNYKNRILNIQRNDIILVDNPNIASKSVIDVLRNSVFIIAHKKAVSKKIENDLPFVFISAKNLKIDEDKYFGFVEKRHFEAEKGRIGWASKVIEDYKKERNQLI